jgi:hypothetical protein
LRVALNVLDLWLLDMSKTETRSSITVSNKSKYGCGTHEARLYELDPLIL